VVEGQQVFVLAAYPNPEILSSSDGINFSNRPIPCVPEANAAVPFVPADLTASDPSDVTVACLGGVGAGNQLKEVFISHDSGQTYQQLPDPPTGGDGAELSMPTPTSVILAAVSGASLVYRIASPDTAWTVLSLGSGGLPLTDLAFVDPSDGALVFGEASLDLGYSGGPPTGSGKLYLTHDGGVTWSPATSPSLGGG